MIVAWCAVVLCDPIQKKFSRDLCDTIHVSLYASGHLPQDIAVKTDGKEKLNVNIQLLQERVVEKLTEWYPTALKENPELTYLMKFHDDVRAGGGGSQWGTGGGGGGAGNLITCHVSRYTDP